MALSKFDCKSKKCGPHRPDNEIEDLVDPKVKARMQDMILSNETLRKEQEIYLDNVNRGLKKETNPSAIIKCFPTYVQDLPNRTETGKFLALDLGGTNFRVLLITLADGKCDMQSEIYVIPKEIFTGSGVELFDHIAKCLSEFSTKYGVQEEKIPLGFTFSFPVTQVGLTKGILKKWTKGFKCDDVIGQDAVQYLIDAIKRRSDVDIDVVAILNDTTGTLMACAWIEPYCRIGLIVGTGSNACYYEYQKNAELYDEPDMGSGRIIINLEMGAFGEDGAIDFILTEEDKVVDQNSINPGGQIHEKCVSGMYLGELMRLRTLAMIKEGLIFQGCPNAQESFEKANFTSEIITSIESDHVNTYTNVKAALSKIGISDADPKDMTSLRYVCRCVSRRSAHLVAASLCVLIKKMDEPYTVVAVDGSVYKYHPHYRRVLEEKMKELLSGEDSKYKFKLMLSEDGSGRGAALVAAVAARKQKEQKG
ncbi:hexokinase type 2-like [Anthonomus grandis grandis]|uniref:hexokinase type 2-like n=1 Tax=Anthonomus grandis grandis TaxID=2921223 RepID=UPI0021650CC5|nr:hexokinase type 2-like [Anthonomus grandis grandis]